MDELMTQTDGELADGILRRIARVGYFDVTWWVGTDRHDARIDMPGWVELSAAEADYLNRIQD